MNRRKKTAPCIVTASSDAVEIRVTQDRGLGVFANRRILADELIERCPVLLFPEKDLYNPEGTANIANYVFAWDKSVVSLSLGYGSLYNHSYQPNAMYEDIQVAGQPCKQFIAIRDIATGEEICVNYNGQPENDAPVGFEVL